MQVRDLPQTEQQRAFIVGLYNALGLQYTPIRVLWDRKWSRANGREAWKNRRDMCNAAHVPFSLTASYGEWDELPREWRDRIEAAWRAREAAACRQ